MDADMNDLRNFEISAAIVFDNRQKIIRTAPKKGSFSFNAATRTFTLNIQDGKMINTTLSIENIMPLQRKQCPYGRVYIIKVDKPGFPYNEVFLRDIAEGDKMLVHNTLLKLVGVQTGPVHRPKPSVDESGVEPQEEAGTSSRNGGRFLQGQSRPHIDRPKFDSMADNPRMPVLRIQRVFKDANGVEYHQTEVVEDPRLVENYLKMRTFCGARKLREFAFADEADLEDFKQFKRKIAKRLNYHANKKKAQELEEKRKRAKSMPFLMKSKESPESNEQTTDSSNSAAENPIDTLCDVCGQKEHSKTSTCPKSLWKVITRDTDAKLTAKDANKATDASADPKIAQQKLAQNSNNNSQYRSRPESIATALHLSSAVNRGTMTRPNAGIKRRYSPGMEVKRPKTATGFH